MLSHRIPLYLVAHVVCAAGLPTVHANAADFYSIVERDGSVVLCLSKGSILFADRCTGDGRLTIVEPIKEGTVVWRSATGTVSLKDHPDPECALSHAEWDQKAEQVISTGKNITKADRTVLLNQLKPFLGGAELVEDDITAFALDLDNDGKQETVFEASNLTRVAQKNRPWVTLAGIVSDNFPPILLYNDHGDYVDDPDGVEFGSVTASSATVIGVVPISPETREIALLISTGNENPQHTLIRYRYGNVQRIEWPIPVLGAAEDRNNDLVHLWLSRVNPTMLLHVADVVSEFSATSAPRQTRGKARGEY